MSEPETTLTADPADGDPAPDLAPHPRAIGIDVGGTGVKAAVVDLATGEVIDWQPDAPADDELRTWAWDEATRRWVAMPTLAALRAAKWEAMKAARDAAEWDGFTWDGSTFDSDTVSQGRIQGAVQLALLAAQADQPFAIDWTLADNTVRTLSGSDAVAVGLALAAHVEAAFARGRELRAEIEAAADAEALAAITWEASP